MVESLGRSLEHERRTGNIPGIKIVAGVKRINHSQFADDILFLGGASSIIARRFKNGVGPISICFRWAC
jgi:hypothetical protein